MASTPVQDAVAEFYLRNCRLRHGHPPKDEDLYVPKPPQPKEPKPKEEAPSVPEKVVEAVVGVGTEAGSGLMRKALPYALAAILGLSGAGLGSYMLWPDGDGGQDVPAARDGSILQYLEDNNWHLP
jgi:hypothetical protein